MKLIRTRMTRIWRIYADFIRGLKFLERLLWVHTRKYFLSVKIRIIRVIRVLIHLGQGTGQHFI